MAPAPLHGRYPLPIPLPHDDDDDEDDNDDDDEKGLFSKYVRTFLKMKTECSGWHQDCDTEESRTAYLDVYERAEGIRLDATRICSNPRRAVAKLCLNSLWGKFGQSSDVQQTEFITTYSDRIQWQGSYGNQFLE